uniref:Polycystic kidney disease 1 like 3 n=1 Tax=Nannospalax galili TaxID=1026970 RepID=A0A8C6RIQ7_NANGA
MFFQERAWLWLFIRVCIILGHEHKVPDQHGKNNCYQLNRLCSSFQEAEQHCRGQGGHLANTWTQESKALIWSSLKEGTKWWVAQNLPKSDLPLGDAAGSRNLKSNHCNSVFRYSKDILLRKERCSQKHHFICQADHFSNPDASNGRIEHNPFPRRPKRGAKTQQKETSGNVFLLQMCGPALAEGFTSAPTDPPQVTSVTSTHRHSPQVTSVTSMPRQSPQVTTVTPAPRDPPQVTSVISVPRDPPQVTSVTSVPRDPPQMTSVTSTPRHSPQVTSHTSAPRYSPQVTSVTSVPRDPPQVTSVTSAPRDPPQVTSVTSVPRDPPQMTSVTSTPRHSPQVTSHTSAPRYSPQVTSVTSVPRDPPQVTSVTSIPTHSPQATSVTSAPRDPPQVTSVTSVPRDPPQVTSVTSTHRHSPQVTSVTSAPRDPPQVTSVTSVPRDPPQVTSVTSTHRHSPQVTSVTSAPRHSPQVTSVTSTPRQSPQVTTVTPAPRDPPQVTLVTSTPRHSPQATSVTSVPRDPPQVTSVISALRHSPQVTSDTSAPRDQPQVTSVTSAPRDLPQVTVTSAPRHSPQVTVPPVHGSPPGPLMTRLTSPVSTSPAGRSLADTTWSPKEDSHSGGDTTHPQTSFQNASSQVSLETGSLRPTVPGLQAHSELQNACNILQRLKDFLPTSPTPAQKNKSWSFKTPSTTCFFQPVEGTVKSGKESQQTSLKNTEQVGVVHADGQLYHMGIQDRLVEDMLEMFLIALGEIQKAFFQQSLSPESSVTLTSSIATLMLSSQNTSTLPLSTYTLGGPAPLRLRFPSAAALKELLDKHPGMNLQIMGLAFNPFEMLDGRNTVGVIGNVLLSSNYRSLQVHDLMEDIEIMFWRNASMETHPTSLNASTDRFTITVNITSLEKSLIVTIEPEKPLLMTLYLGFQDQPDHAHFHLDITLPRGQVWQKDEEYTWLLSPESLQYGTGTYNITAVVNQSSETTLQTPFLVSVVTAVTQCYFWDTYNRTWRSDGCQVGPQSTALKTQCLCNHLTFFSADFFIVPRTVRVEDTIKLFLHVTNNPVGVSLLASLLGLYVILVMWAWRKDQADEQKVKVTVLADNDPSSQFHYVVQVYTGYRRQAATTAKVVITLYGSEGHSEPHHLWDPQKMVFERGALDVFLLSTRSSLGELHGLRLWHDNSGGSPAWYVSQVIVSDMAAKRKWHFLCSCWLATDLGDCERDVVFRPASRKELSSFRHLFSSMIVEKFTQDYLWLSVATRHPWNQFTRVQRLTCCMTLLLCDMVINVMFWKMGGTPAKRGRQKDPFTVTWSELFISVQTAAILFPIHLVIGRLFPLSQPQEILPPLPPIQASCPLSVACEPPSLTKVVEELKETVGFLLRRNTHLLSEYELSSWSSCDTNKLVKLLSSLIYSHVEDRGCYRLAGSHWVSENHRHFCRYLLQVLQRLKSHLDVLGLARVHQSCDFLEAASHLQNLQKLLEAQILSREQGDTTSFPILSPEEGKKLESVYLFTWLTSTCWLLLGVISLASAFFIALYTLELSKDQATSWVVSMMLSVLQDIFISQPMKVIFLTFFFSVMMNQVPQLNKDKEQQTKRIVALWAKCSSLLPSVRDENNPIYRAPAMTSPAKRPEREWKKNLLKLTGDVLVQTLFLVLLMTTIYSAKNSNQFFLHQAIWKSFSHHFSEIKLLEDFYPWANHTLLPNLYGDYRGFITDGNSFLLGNVLLRQIRIPNAILSPVSVQEQVKPYPQHQEDTANYGVGWGPPDPNTTQSDSIWHYQNQESLGGSPIQGEFAAYSGGGYVVRLGRKSSTATRVLQHLQQTHWLDHCTKVLFVEFVVFNANVNLFCVVTLILESTGVGPFFTSLRLDSLTSLQIAERGFAWIVSQVIYYLLICYYTFIQGRRLKRQRWRFFTRKRNILDTSIILISFNILGLDLWCISLHHKNMLRYHHDRDRFVNFHEALQVSSAVIYLMGFLVLLATVQLWDLLRHNPQFQVISKTMNKAWDEVVGFLLIILILLTSYAMTFNLLFGWSISDYQSFFSSAVTVVGSLMGISNHKEVISLHPVLGFFLILTSVILMGLVIINLFVSAILIAFGEERKSLKKEAALTDMLLQKLSSLLAIRQHNPSAEKQNNSSSNLRERSSKSMSSDAEVLAPADAVGSVSGTDGNSGNTK